MDSDVSNDPVLIKPGLIAKEFFTAIDDFSQYLSRQKKDGNRCLEISENSQTLISKWGQIQLKATDDFFFQGPTNANICIVDSDGSFFNGESGKLLEKILSAMNLSSGSVFICTITDRKKLQETIKSISPKVIITLGTKACHALLNDKLSLKQVHGKFQDFFGIKVMPTFHPSLLLKHPEYKRQVWEDMKLVIEYAGLKDDS
jgi:uracil-DNA glycosylase family 4